MMYSDYSNLPKLCPRLTALNSIEDARTKRGLSDIGYKLRKIAKTLCPCSVSYTCFEHPFTILTLTVEIGAL